VGRLRGSDLVAVALPPGRAWLDVLAEAWEAGAAVLPVDHRLPDIEAERLLARAMPTAIAGGDGIRRVTGGTPAGEGVRLVMPTSGTSAEPKLVELTGEALTAALDASARRIGAAAAGRWLCCLPVAHMGGMLVLLRAVVQGAPVVVAPSFDVDAVTAAIASGARLTSLVPTMLRRLLDANVALGGFDTILVGGSGMDPALRRRARAAGGNVIQTYGLTESCGGVVYDGLAVDGVEVRASPADGQVFLRGPTLMRGYRVDPEATAAALDPDGWLATRDAGSIDGGLLTIHGRLDDAILSGGETVWPEQVEAALRTHPLVGDVAVTGAPDLEWGQRVVAHVAANEPSDPPSLEDLRAHVARMLPRHAAPRELVLVARLPRTASGKLRRRAVPRADRFGPSEAPR
jgi:o-succinylbenzoate---CoA ligase